MRGEGEAEDEVDGIMEHKIMDSGKNSQEERLVDFPRSTNMCGVNDRKGREAFMCVSGRGGSVVD